MAGVLVCCGRDAVGQANPAQNRFSTHDWTLPTSGGAGGEPIIGTNDFREFWADVKTAGDGFAYSVGTIEVRTTVVAFFSGAPAEPPAQLLPGFTIPAPLDPARQVVMLQQADPNSNQLGWQRFFHGTNSDQSLRATHGRGVSVWPAINAADTRIAICGESQDEALPDSNVEGGWPGAGGAGSAGFIAMFNGLGDLLWSHHFFGVAADQHCAITDVSVRFDERTGLDVVTFCGISTYGMPAANATLTAVQPFAAPLTLCANSAGGATDNGAGQWDGIVGRLTSPHAAPVPATVQFLSCVGGSQQDGLFGLVEIDEERYAVVGSTGNNGFVPPGADFPVTLGNCPAFGTPPFSAGVVAVFGPVVGGALTLEMSQVLGLLEPGTDTAARDVALQRQWSTSGEPGLVIVGATTDGALLSAASLAIPPTVQPQAAIGGAVDGFVLGGHYVAPSPTLPNGVVVWTTATYRGGPGSESLTGVQGWSEFYDVFAVTGPDDQNGGGIDVASYSKLPPATAPAFALLTGGATVAMPTGGAQIGGTGIDRPTAVAVPANGPPMFNATTLGGFDEFGLGNPAGGGITVDPTGRVHVVGTTTSANFPVQAGGRAKTGVTHDAVRIALDMLPVGVGRTDGTAALPLPAGSPGYPLPGVFGGTTPECALTPFGHQIGLTDPQAAPAAPRMLIDWEGPAPAAGVNGAVVVSRPPNSSFMLGAALQFNFPGTNPAAPGPFPLLPDGVLLWTTDPSAVMFTLTPTGPEALRFPLNALPAGPVTLTAQLVCLLAVPVLGGAIGPVCPGGGQSGMLASPAMWLDW